MHDDESPVHLYLRESDDDDDEHVRIDAIAYDHLTAPYSSSYDSDNADKPVTIAVSVGRMYAYPIDELPPFTLSVPPERANSFNIELPTVRDVGVVEQRR